MLDLDVDVDEKYMALISGIGLVLAVIFFALYIYPENSVLLYGILAFVLSILFPFFFLLHEMSFAPVSMSETISWLLAGVILVVLAFVIAWSFHAAPSEGWMVATQAIITVPSVALLIYSQM